MYLVRRVGPEGKEDGPVPREGGARGAGEGHEQVGARGEPPPAVLARHARHGAAPRLRVLPVWLGQGVHGPWGGVQRVTFKLFNCAALE